MSQNKSKTTTPRCRHRKVWIFASHGGYAQVLWCYACGAIRTYSDVLRKMVWYKPVGPDGENPAVVEYDRDQKKNKKKGVSK